MEREQINKFYIPDNKKLIIVRGAPTQERDQLAVRIAEVMGCRTFVRRIENHFMNLRGEYEYHPERVLDAIDATRNAVRMDLRENGMSIAAGTFIRRKHIMEYAYDEFVDKRDVLVLEISGPPFTPNETGRALPDLLRLQTERETYLHSFIVTPDCEFAIRPKFK